jgi:hypothetical protein
LNLLVFATGTWKTIVVGVSLQRHFLLVRKSSYNGDGLTFEEGFNIRRRLWLPYALAGKVKHRLQNITFS